MGHSSFVIHRKLYSLTVYCTAPIPGHWSVDHSFLSLCPQSSAFHSKICQLSLGKENKLAFITVSVTINLLRRCKNTEVMAKEKR